MYTRRLHPLHRAAQGHPPVTLDTERFPQRRFDACILFAGLEGSLVKVLKEPGVAPAAEGGMSRRAYVQHHPPTEQPEEPARETVCLTAPPGTPSDVVASALRRVSRSGDSVSVRDEGEFCVRLTGVSERLAGMVGHRMALAVKDRLDINLTVKVVSDSARESEKVELPGDPGAVPDGYSIRRAIPQGEPAVSGRGLLQRARSRMQDTAALAA